MTIDQKPAPLGETAQIVDTLASQCVKCALCLPHCPTYKVTEDENESPRGRIALMQAVAQQALPLTEKVKGHLDGCLACNACERVCPAKVSYGTLLDEGRYLFATMDPSLHNKGRSRLLSAFIRLLPSHRAMRSLQWILWGLQKTGLRRFAQLTHLNSLLGLARYEALLPNPVTPPVSIASYYPPLGPARGTVQLFLGCLTSLCEKETLLAAIAVLRRCGYAVHVPPEQTCCGAIHLHAGELPKAKALAARNQQAFQAPSDHTIDAIVSLATGCTVVLDDTQPTAIDLISFLMRHAEIPQAQLKPLDYDVWVQTPCTRKNVLRETQDPERLLGQIPGLRVHAITHPDCCGAAGAYMLEHPHMADQLGDALLKSLENRPIDYLATTNIGCGLHLQERLKALNPGVKTIHPVVLLAQSLACL